MRNERRGEICVRVCFWFEGGENEKRRVRRGEEGAEVYQKQWEIKVREWGGLQVSHHLTSHQPIKYLETMLGEGGGTSIFRSEASLLLGPVLPSLTH